MTEFDIQESLFDIFKRLNTFSGISFLDADYKNVSFPNVPFTAPQSKRWFELVFRNNEPVESAILNGGAQNRFTGILFINIITPIDVGESEAVNKYKWILKLYNDNVYYEDVAIKRVYVSSKDTELDHYRLQCAVEWEADIDKE